MVFASPREHASTTIFFAGTSRDKKNCFASSEQFREHNSRVASTYENKNLQLCKV